MMNDTPNPRSLIAVTVIAGATAAACLWTASTAEGASTRPDCKAKTEVIVNYDEPVNCELNGRDLSLRFPWDFDFEEALRFCDHSGGTLNGSRHTCDDIDY